MKGIIFSIALVLFVGQSYGWAIGRHIRMDCPLEEEFPTFYPDATDCTKYYVCSNGNPVHMDCPSVLHWNAEKNVCDSPLEANCDASGSLLRIEVRDEMTCPFPEETPTFYPDAQDCTKYYECSNGVPVHMECPTGLHWNKEKNSCDTPANAQCVPQLRNLLDEMTCPFPEEMPTFYPDLQDCTKYYECSNGVPVHMECPAGLHWNKEKNSCDTPANAQCVPQLYLPILQRRLMNEMNCPLQEDIPTFYSDPTDCTRYYVCSNGLPIHMECPLVLHWNAEKNVCDSPLEANCDASGSLLRIEVRDEMTCPFPEETPTFYPDPQDCTKYYECSNGVPVHMECPTGLHWNKEKNSCDTPANAQCVPQLRNLLDEMTCPFPEEMPTFYPDLQDCTKYYECSNGVPVHMECPTGLHWNKEKNSCDTPANAQCVPQLRNLLDDMTCPFPEEMPTFYPDPQDCNKYYECSNGVPVHMECPPGLHWNKEKNSCDTPANAQCVPQLRNLLDEMTCPFPEEMPTFYPDLQDCTKYYECSNGVPVHMECPTGLHWNKEKNSCDTPANAQCVPQLYLPILQRSLMNEMNCPLQEDIPTFYSDPTDCTRYYVCSNGLPIHMECPSVLHWNAEKNVCDSPLEANCDASGSLLRIEVRDEMTCPFPEETPTFYPDPQDCTKYYECSNGVPVHMECPTGLHWNKEKNSCDTPANAQCVPQLRNLLDEMTCPFPEEMPTFFPDPSDCNKYYECSNGVPVHMICPPGLHWNKEKNSCDTPANAQCVSQFLFPYFY